MAPRSSASSTSPAPVIGGAAARIGILLHDFPAGGTERIAIRLANAWAAAGREVTLFCGCVDGPARRRVDPGVTIAAAVPAIPRSLASRRRFGRALPAMLAARPVDVLVAPGNFHLAVLGAAGRLPCAVVCKLSNPLVRPGRGSIEQAVFRWVSRFATRHVDRLVAMSPALAVEARRVLPVFTTIAEPILDDRPVPRRRRGTEAPVVLCAGRMVPQKRLALALEAFVLAPAAARLVILGDGPERGALEAMAARFGIAGRVSFVGHVPEIASWLAEADVFLLSSDYEGYPAVLVEAIAAGVPVVTTSCSPAIPEILAHPSFGRISPSDPAALAATLAAVLAAGPVDEAARLALADRHHVDNAAAAWLAMLDRTVAARQG